MKDFTGVVLTLNTVVDTKQVNKKIWDEVTIQKLLPLSGVRSV